MTVAEILHKLQNDSAFLFRDFGNGGLSATEQSEFKKQQAILREVAEILIRKTIKEESTNNRR